jgi:hypothetical protein
MPKYSSSLASRALLFETKRKYIPGLHQTHHCKIETTIKPKNKNPHSNLKPSAKPKPSIRPTTKPKPPSKPPQNQNLPSYILATKSKPSHHKSKTQSNANPATPPKAPQHPNPITVIARAIFGIFFHLQ